MEQRVVDPRVRFFLGGGGNSLVFLHGREALVADVKFAGAARQLRADVEGELGREVSRLLLTHSHDDHTGGLKLYPRVGAVIVHPNARKRLEAEGFSAPYVEVARELTLLLGGETIRVLSPGRGHTDGDLVALLESRKLLVAGDLVINGYEPAIDLKAGGDALEFGRTLDRILALNFERVLPGHGEPMTRADVERERDFFRVLEADVRAARVAGLSVEDTVKHVTMPQFELQPIPTRANRETSVRRMFESLEREALDEAARVRQKAAP